MGNRNKLKKYFQDRENPRILTLEQALAFRDELEEPGSPFINPDPDGRSIEAVLDRINTRFRGLEDMETLSYGERMVLKVVGMMDEVYQGGFAQYLYNPSGDDAEITRSMLRGILALKTANLLDRVSRFFPDGRIPEDSATRCDALDEFEDENPDEEPFEEESLLFYKSEENLYTLMVEYIRDHMHEFAEPSDEIVQKFKRMNQIMEYLGTGDD